jgi:hypothetical protein
MRSLRTAAAFVASAVVIMAVPAITRQAHGSIEGRITFDGTPPPPTTVAHDGGAQPVLYVDRSGGLRFAVVYLPDGGAAGPIPDAARLNQRNFIFQPQVLAIRAGQPVRFTSDDPANHNVRARGARPENTFSINTAPGSVGPVSRTFVATPPERPLQLACDIHPWMAAWLYVFDHDLFAVSAPDGRYRIDGVPPGRHRIAIRQPSGRLARDLSVDVRAGETARLDHRFTPADIGMPTR